MNPTTTQTAVNVTPVNVTPVTAAGAVAPALPAVATIERDELKAKLDRGDRFALLEALPERYFRKAHLPGARWMPNERVAELAPRLIEDPKDDVVVYCASETCMNSHRAAAELVRLGYPNVRVYAGGKADWQSANYPTET